MRRRSLTWVWWALLLLAPNAGAQASPAVISRGTDAGGFSAFPDICRAKDGELLFAFYSGSGHVTTPSAKWPKCGRIMAIRSGDEGKTWSKPVVIVDTPDDDRDPSLSCLKDGTLLMNWFALVPAAPSARALEWRPSAAVPFGRLRPYLGRAGTHRCQVGILVCLLVPDPAAARRLATVTPLLRGRERRLRRHDQVA